MQCSSGSRWVGTHDRGRWTSDALARPADWPRSKPADPAAMLEDILEAGVYGQSSMSRHHSGALVLRAAEEEKTHTNLI